MTQQSKNSQALDAAQKSNLEDLAKVLNKLTQAAELDEALKLRQSIEDIKSAKRSLLDLNAQLVESQAKVASLEADLKKLADKRAPADPETLTGEWRWFDCKITVFPVGGRRLI